MQARLSYRKAAPEAAEALLNMEKTVRSSALGDALIDLVYLRVSQVNGCAYCVDAHSHDLRKNGETPQRLAALVVWRDAPFFSDRERAALAYAEAVTRLGPHGVGDDVFQAALAEFGERELALLTLGVSAINAWNRFGIAFRLAPPRRSESS